MEANIRYAKRYTQFKKYFNNSSFYIFMINMLDTRKKTLIYALFSWLIPFLLSFFLYNPETKQYLPSFLIFKIIMFVILVVITIIFYNFIRKDSEKLFSLSVPNTFSLINCVLDIIFLIILFRMDFVFWSLSVLPIYLFTFYILSLVYILRK